MKRTRRDPSKYLASLPDDVRPAMEGLDRLITSVLKGRSRVVWEGVFWGGTDQVIIGYGDLVQKQSRGREVEWFLVGLALQKNYISLYVNAVVDGEYAAERYQKALGKVKVGKASISFQRLEDVNLTVLRKVIAIARDQG